MLKRIRFKKPFKKHKDNLDYAKMVLKWMLDEEGVNYAIIFVPAKNGVKYFWRRDKEKGQGFVKTEEELTGFLMEHWRVKNEKLAL